MNAKILLVEDDPLLVRMYEEKFKEDGFNVQTALDGQEGLEKATSFRPDIILMDIMMPKMNGFQVLETLKKTPGLQNIPVLLLTNLGDNQGAEKGLSLGAADYIIKVQTEPVDVVKKIKTTIESSHQEKHG